MQLKYVETKLIAIAIMMIVSRRFILLLTVFCAGLGTIDAQDFALTAAGAFQTSSSGLSLSSTLGEIQNISGQNINSKPGIIQYDVSAKQQIIDSIMARGYQGIPGIVDVTGASISTFDISLAYTLGEVKNLGRKNANNQVIKEGVLQVISDIVTLQNDKEASDHDFMLYPNPFHHNVHLDFSKDEIAQVEVVSMSGEILLKDVNGNRNLDLSHLPSGVYMVLVISDLGKVQESKITKL